MTTQTASKPFLYLWEDALWATCTLARYVKQKTRLLHQQGAQNGWAQTELGSLTVFALPPREGCRMRVSFESRYGM